MPSQNPKHIRRQVLYTRQHEYKSAPPQLKYLLMGGIGIVVITAVVVLAIYLPKANQNNNVTYVIVENGDWIKQQYKYWVDRDEDGIIDINKDTPIDDSFDLPNDIWQVQVKPSNFPILGWYNNLLGMKNGTSKYITIPAAKDENQDGIDDNTGQPVQTFKSGEDAYKKLLIWVYIVQVTKQEDWNPNQMGVNSLTNAMLTANLEFNKNLRIKIPHFKI